jgi:hypothetical protein
MLMKRQVDLGIEAGEKILGNKDFAPQIKGISQIFVLANHRSLMC